MSSSDLYAGGSRRSLRITSSALLVGALAAGTLAATTTSAQAASDRTWNRLAACESGGNWSINTGNGYYGGLQFSASTWRAYGGGKFAAYANQASRAEQITIAERVLRGQGWGAWPSCSSKLGLDGSDAREKWDGRKSKNKLKAVRKHEAQKSRVGLRKMTSRTKPSSTRLMKLSPVRR